MREGLQCDIQFAGMRASEYVHQVNEAHRRPAIIRWSVVGLLAAILIFAVGHRARVFRTALEVLICGFYCC